ncbi:hypothetical protein BGP_3711 [Beggiatoa sp. PS]|nr:hypothetical protein BGP_3711 [Beggiatoa sp. PS]
MSESGFTRFTRFSGLKSKHFGRFHPENPENPVNPDSDNLLKKPQGDNHQEAFFMHTKNMQLILFNIAL